MDGIRLWDPGKTLVGSKKQPMDAQNVLCAENLCTWSYTSDFGMWYIYISLPANVSSTVHATDYMRYNASETSMYVMTYQCMVNIIFSQGICPRDKYLRRRGQFGPKMLTLINLPCPTHGQHFPGGVHLHFCLL